MSNEQYVRPEDLINYQSLAQLTYVESIESGSHKILGINGFGNFFVTVNGNTQEFGRDAEAAATCYNNN